jgi:hypothetical protein
MTDQQKKILQNNNPNKVLIPNIDDDTAKLTKKRASNFCPEGHQFSKEQPTQNSPLSFDRLGVCKILQIHFSNSRKVEFFSLGL